MKTIASKARALREHHRDRHTSTGLGFTLADSIDDLDNRWEALTATSSIFLSREYLRVLESALPENLHQRYALVLRGQEPIAAVAAQSVAISMRRLAKTGTLYGNAAFDGLKARMLVCGNLLSWGSSGVAFKDGETRTELWAAVAEALYRIRRSDRLLGDSDVMMIKDVPEDEVAQAATLRRFSYRPLRTEPDMVLELRSRWRSRDDYLADLTATYRKALRKVVQDVDASGCSVETLTNVADRSDELHALYMQVHERQKLRLITLSPHYLPGLARALGAAMRCTVVRRGDRVLGFVTTVRDGETAVGYYMGFDDQANREMPVYFRLLLAVIENAIELNCRRVSYGRTALEPKARLGARPAPLGIWLRHRVPAINLVMRALLCAVPHPTVPERNPFK